MKSKAIQHLEALANEQKQQKYSGIIPGHAISKASYTDKTTNGLTACIIDFLRFQGHYAVRINTQGNYSEKAGKWVKSGTTPGTADIHSCIDGQHVSIEIKTGRDRQSTKQRATQQQIEAAGGRYLVARNFQEFFNWYYENR